MSSRQNLHNRTSRRIYESFINSVNMLIHKIYLWHHAHAPSSTTVLARARAILHVYVHNAHFGSIVGASHVLDCYRQLGLICDAHSASLHVIVVLEHKSLLHSVLFMLEDLCMSSWTHMSMSTRYYMFIYAR